MLNPFRGGDHGDDRGGDRDAQCLHEQGGEVQPDDPVEIRGLRLFVGRMLEGDGYRAGDDGEDLAGGCHRQRDGDSVRDALATLDDQDRRDRAGQGGVR